MALVVGARGFHFGPATTKLNALSRWVQDAGPILVAHDLELTNVATEHSFDAVVARCSVIGDHFVEVPVVPARGDIVPRSFVWAAVLSSAAPWPLVVVSRRTSANHASFKPRSAWPRTNETSRRMLVLYGIRDDAEDAHKGLSWPQPIHGGARAVLAGGTHRHRSRCPCRLHVGSARAVQASRRATEHEKPKRRPHRNNAFNVQPEPKHP
mmetsp:Transcript_22052/g.61774  ORF Transcript_22052/g.61774 Transcript_22052/m.61774 type:complete len:210 (+) Transcript_22052:1390-2019(+)